MELSCPQCKNTLKSKSPKFRLVQDSCGHKKCRICLLLDESECKLCAQNKKSNSTHSQTKDVMKYENNHTTVITCNRYQSTDIPDKQHNTNNIYNQTLSGKSDVEEQQIKFSCKNTKPSKNSNPEKKRGIKRSYKFLVIPNHICRTGDSSSTYKCKICNKTFGTRSHIRYHLYCVGGQKPYRCDVCDKEFISKSHFESHCFGHKNMKPFTCDTCRKPFTQLSKLNRHKQIHLETKPYVCQQCGKTFSNKTYLKTHCYIHSGEKPFSCQLCNAKFNNSSNLNKHIATHSKEQLHMCDQCGKRFKVKWALTVHRRSHSRLRPHKCSTCTKTFINAKELHRHELIHLDIKSYTCSLCGTSFRRKDNLNRHIRNTHPGKKAVCIKKPLKVSGVVNEFSKVERVVENPNAINVITPTCTSNTSSSRPVPVINAPLKLAFKTTAFKSHYNIHSREYIEPQNIHPKPYDLAESVSICQKILSPCNPSHSIVKNVENTTDSESKEIYQKILSPLDVPPSNNDTYTDNKTHAIRNIKFKLPTKYTNKYLEYSSPLQPPVNSSNVTDKECTNNSNVYTELKAVPLNNKATSVIVNTQSTQATEIHWRRRTMQNLGLQ